MTIESQTEGCDDESIHNKNTADSMPSYARRQNEAATASKTFQQLSFHYLIIPEAITLNRLLQCEGHLYLGRFRIVSQSQIDGERFFGLSCSMSVSRDRISSILSL